MVLVTGATGFVGKHLVEELLNNGYKVRVLIRPNSNIKDIKSLNVDIKVSSPFNADDMNTAVKDIEYVVHCAGALKGIRWEDYYKGNFLYTKNLVDAVKKYNPGIKKFIFISSQAASGPSTSTPKKEIDFDKPISFYGKSKLLAENELKDSRIPYIILRPSSIYGPGDTEFFPLFKMAEKNIHLLVNRGKNKINLIYVKDFINAIMLSIKKEVYNKTYYVSDGNEYLWKDICDIVSKTVGKKYINLPIPGFIASIVGNINTLISKITGKPLLLNRDKIKEGRCKYWLFDISLIKKELGFEPSVKPEDGFRYAYKWYVQEGWL